METEKDNEKLPTWASVSTLTFSPCSLRLNYNQKKALHAYALIAWSLCSLALHLTRLLALSSVAVCPHIQWHFHSCAALLLLFSVQLLLLLLTMSVLSLTPSLMDFISSSLCLHWMCRRCLLSLWSDSLLAWFLEQLSNLINSIIRPLLLPGCFTRVQAPEAESIQGLWPNGDQLV